MEQNSPTASVQRKPDSYLFSFFAKFSFQANSLYCYVLKEKETFGIIVYVCYLRKLKMVGDNCKNFVIIYHLKLYNDC